jgi:hypothetical protein
MLFCSSEFSPSFVTLTFLIQTVKHRISLIWYLAHISPRHFWMISGSRKKQGRKWNSKSKLKWRYIFQKLWDVMKAVLRGKFTAISAYVRNSEIDNLTMHVKSYKSMNKQIAKLV